MDFLKILLDFVFPKDRRIINIIKNDPAMIKPSKRKSVDQLIKPFPGRWVALSADDREVVSVARTFKSALNRAHKKGESSPHMIKSPDGSVAAFIF